MTRLDRLEAGDEERPCLTADLLLGPELDVYLGPRAYLQQPLVAPDEGIGDVDETVQQLT